MIIADSWTSRRVLEQAYPRGFEHRPRFAWGNGQEVLWKSRRRRACVQFAIPQRRLRDEQGSAQTERGGLVVHPSWPGDIGLRVAQSLRSRPDLPRAAATDRLQNDSLAFSARSSEYSMPGDWLTTGSGGVIRVFGLTFAGITHAPGARKQEAL